MEGPMAISPNTKKEAARLWNLLPREPVVPEAVEVEVEVFVAEPAAEVDHPLCGLNAKQAKAWVEAVGDGDVDVLADALAAERDGRKRKSVIALLKARLDSASE